MLSGGSLASLTAVVTAREAAGLRASEFERAVFYASSHAHHCVEKALRVAGLGEAVHREVALDDRFRMLPDSLADLVATDRAEGLIRRIEAAGLKAIPTGIAHGTVTAVADGKPFEITTLRVDVETDGRRAKVAFTDGWVADAARRDFTFNALSCAPDGTFYDPFEGAADLAAGRVRFVGEARTRIEEDYLRLLRFFRFQAHYGKEPPDPETLLALSPPSNLLWLVMEKLR